MSGRVQVSRDIVENLREKLQEVLRTSDVDFGGELRDDTSLIKSGKLDSLSLFNMALFIEHEVGRKIDITRYDLAKEWDTLADIVNFIVKLRSSA